MYKKIIGENFPQTYVAFSKKHEEIPCGGCGLDLFKPGKKSKTKTNWSYDNMCCEDYIEHHRDPVLGSFRHDIYCVPCGDKQGKPKPKVKKKDG